MSFHLCIKYFLALVRGTRNNSFLPPFPFRVPRTGEPEDYVGEDANIGRRTLMSQAGKKKNGDSIESPHHLILFSNYCFFNCPLISPPGCSVVCKFTYIESLKSSVTCCSVRAGLVKVIGEVRSVKGKMTGPFVPATAR